MTTFARHPAFHLQKGTIGREGEPLVVVDNLLADADGLVELAAAKMYGSSDTYYPGIRAKVPLAYQLFVISQMSGDIADVFGLRGKSLRFTTCHFSLVTTPGSKLGYRQRIPHVDSANSAELAFVHYLFRADLGGTAFYRHRNTGFEYVDQSRLAEYSRHVNAEQAGPDAPREGYICGSTPLYEQIGEQAGVFNRLVMYRRTTLHSGVIRPDYSLDPNPRTGRLSVTGFMA